MISVIFFIGALIFLFMSCAFIIAYIKEDNSVADIAWGIGFIIAVWGSFFYKEYYQPLALCVCILVTMWGLRLVIQITLKNKGKDEDERYKKMREKWGKTAPMQSFFKVFMLQGFLLLIIAYQLEVINSSSQEPITYLSFIAIGFWVIGFLCETIADYQLYCFTKNNAHKGKILTSGLWRYSRHPNYFGEIVMWWSIYCIAYTAPHGLSAIISPLTITYLLIFVSGIPMAEKTLEKNEQFQEYKKRTSVLIPWFPYK